MLLAASDASALDFDKIMDVFGACFHTSRTAKSLRAHYYRLKRMDAQTDLSMVDLARKVLEVWDGRREAAESGTVATKAGPHADAIREFTVESLTKPGHARLPTPESDACEGVDSVQMDESGGAVAAAGKDWATSEGQNGDDSSDSTLCASDELKRRKTSPTSSPARSTSPLMPDLNTPEPLSPEGSPATPSDKFRVVEASPQLPPSTAPTSDVPMCPATGEDEEDVEVADENVRTGQRDGPAPILSPLDMFSAEQVRTHIQALKSEAFVRRFRPIIMRMYDHHMNCGVFNEPVNPITLGLPDYFTIVDVPMDLGTVRQKLEAGKYTAVEELSADVCLVFHNALRYNPEGHPVHLAAGRMLDEYQNAVKKLSGKLDVDRAKKAAHACNFCQGACCSLCGDKCLLFDPVVYMCDCCGERIRRSTVFYRSGSGNRWCAKCVSNGGSNCVVGGVKPPKLSRAQMLQRRKSISTPTFSSEMTPFAVPPVIPPSRFVLKLNLASKSVTAQERVEAAPSPLTLEPCLSPGVSAPDVASPSLKFAVRPGNVRLEKRRNDDVVAEPWVQCDSCRSWVHQVCAMFNQRKNNMLTTSASYTCPACRLDHAEEAEKKTSNSNTSPACQSPSTSSFDEFLSAASLPCTDMSREIELRVRRKMTAVAGEALGSSLTVREVSSVPQSLEVPPALRALLTVPSPSPQTVRSVLASYVASDLAGVSSDKEKSGGEEDSRASPMPAPTSPSSTTTAPAVAFGAVTQYPASLPYRQRVLLLFQRLDGVDVCLFGLYVQEYGASCPAPNTGRVYIAYLDSVRYLRPLQARTAVYHELMCAYMANARLRGFVGANIWACPPQRGDGYIFHCHPLQQRTPDKKRLRAWYIQLLNQSEHEGVVDSVSQLADDYFAEDGSLNAGKGLPPFFAGDFWSVESERVLRDIARLRAKGKGKGLGKSKASGAATPAPTAEAPLLPPSPSLTPLPSTDRSVSGSANSADRVAVLNDRRFMRSSSGKSVDDAKPDALTLQRRTSNADGDDAEAGGDGGAEGDDTPALESFTSADMEKFDLVKMIGSRIRSMRSDFLVVEFKPLTAAQQDAALAASAACDANDRICCDFFDTRSGFLRMCQGNNYQVRRVVWFLVPAC
jgi:Histone acetylation protein/Bromodomain/PHD-finger